MPKVLVVEDDELTRSAISIWLEDAGFDVIAATNAEAGLKIINHQTFNAVFTDVQMPGAISGADLARIIARRFPRTGILVASGRFTAEELELPDHAVYLSKPYSFETVISTLRALSGAQ